MGQKVVAPSSEDPEEDILTPQAPSIAFPLAKPLVAPEPQVSASWNLPGYFQHAAAAVNFFRFCQEEKEEENQPPRFQLSSLSPQERIDYSHLIEELGESLSFSGDQMLKYVRILYIQYIKKNINSLK